MELKMQSLRQLYKVGPGPSSSHTIGPKIACEMFLKEFSNSKKYIVTLYGSLALTSKGHGTDKIIKSVLGESKTQIKYVEKELSRHPNALEIEDDLKNKYRVYSIGGGTIEIEGKEHLLEMVYPVNTWGETIKYLKDNKLTLIEFIEHIEGKDIWKYMKYISKTFLTSIERGIKAEPGLLIDDEKGFKVKKKAMHLWNGANKEKDQTIKNKLLVSAYAHAVSEGSAQGENIVTSPTCGACGVLPAVYKYAIDKHKIRERVALEGIMVAGYIGNLIKHKASISGAEGGCQAEIGSATAMASAMMTYIRGYDNEVIEYAALSSIEHSLGLTCDPIGGYVLVPCIERNAVYANKAIDISYMSAIISKEGMLTLDKVIMTMKQTGEDIKSEYRETSKGGLAVCWNT